MNQSLIPQDFQAFLPSYQVSELQIDRDKNYIIESLLRNSDLTGWRWLFDTYSKDDLVKVVMQSKNLREKDIRIWMKVFNIKSEDVACLQTKSHPTHSSSWHY